MVYSLRGSIPYHRPKFPLDTFKGASYIKGSARKKKRYFLSKLFFKKVPQTTFSALFQKVAYGAVYFGKTGAL